MIVRIAGGDQYRMPSIFLDELNDLDDQAINAVAHDDEPQLHRLLESMNELVETKGEAVPLHELVTSDVTLPDAELTLAEAKHLFTGEGIVPD